MSDGTYQPIALAAILTTSNIHHILREALLRRGIMHG